MGADVVGWRDCSLQQSLGEEGFFRNLKLLAYQRAADRHLLEADRSRTPIRVYAGGEIEVLSYAAIAAELAGFERGVPECPSCPLSGGKPLGCYRYVTFPVSVGAEEALATHAATALHDRASPAREIFTAYRSSAELQSVASAFRMNRGPTPPSLAARAEPVQLAMAADDVLFDSADVLAVVLTPVQEGEHLATLGEFWQRVLESGEVADASWSEWRELGLLFLHAAELARTTPGVALLVDA